MRWPFTRNTYWQDMDDIEWLDYVIRDVHRVEVEGHELEGLLVFSVALHGLLTVELRAENLEDLIREARRLENEDLMQYRKRKWRLRWFKGK